MVSILKDGDDDDDDEFKEDKMSGACGMDGRNEKCIQYFDRKT
jgi:hypothetical protein